MSSSGQLQLKWLDVCLFGCASGFLYIIFCIFIFLSFYLFVFLFLGVIVLFLVFGIFVFGKVVDISWRDGILIYGFND